MRPDIIRIADFVKGWAADRTRTVSNNGIGHIFCPNDTVWGSSKPDRVLRAQTALVQYVPSAAFFPDPRIIRTARIPCASRSTVENIGMRKRPSHTIRRCPLI